MHHEQNRPLAYCAYCDPPFFRLEARISLCDRKWILKHESRGFKANLVLAQISVVLVLVPLKSHQAEKIRISQASSDCQYICTYTFGKMSRTA